MSGRWRVWPRWFSNKQMNMDNNMNSHPVVLVTNDDGIDAPGIHRLIDYLAPLGARIVAVAPLHPHSGQSSAITVSRAITMQRRPDYGGAEMAAVDGTPVDCVKLGIHAMLGGRKPDVVVAGINHGSNSGINVIYSGTMGAVLEGCILDIPSIGFSYHDHDTSASLECCRPVVEAVTRRVLVEGLPKGVCLNVNMPRLAEGERIKGVRVCRAAAGYWTEEYADYTDPHGRPFFWLTGSFHNLEPDNPDTDLYWTDRGYASVVPCRVDQSAVDVVAPLGSGFNSDYRI